ncbi:MAG: hypothetical protein V4490_05125, partial [Pseudomonadota bacterium]
MKSMVANRYVVILFLTVSSYGVRAANLSPESKELKPNQKFPLPGRMLAAAGLSDTAMFGGDGMLPIMGNEEQFVYLDLLGRHAADSTFLVSPGLGYRAIRRNVVVGGYLFADYNRTSLHKNFLVLSPGLEVMGLKWDFHLNGYFPTQHSKALGPTDYASNLGYSDNVYFETGTHNQYDHRANPVSVVGNGIDAAIGYSFSKKDVLRSRIYFGGYYYKAPSVYGSSIAGATAGFNNPVNKTLSLRVFNSYDRLNRYRIGAELNVVFGGTVNTLSKDIHDRQLDPVQRHVGIIATGAGTYDQRTIQRLGNNLQYSNIYFVTPNGTGDGTYGNPAPLTQEILDDINTTFPDDARLYLQGGGSTYTIDDTYLTPYNGQNFYGRTYDYTSYSSGDDRPTLFQPDGTAPAAIFLIGEYGDSSNTFSDLQFTSNFTPGAGSSGIHSTQNITNTSVCNSAFSFFDAGGLLFENVESNLTVTNSTFDNNSVAIQMKPAEGSLNIQNSLITIDSDFAVGTVVNPTGIFIENLSSGDITFTANNVQILFNSNTAAAQGFVLQNRSNGQIDATINNLTLSGAGDAANAFEIYNGFGDSAGGTVNVTLENSLITSNSGSGYGGIVITANTHGITNFDLLNTTVSDNGTYGLLVLNNNDNDTINVTIENSVFEGNGINYGPDYPFGNIGLWSQGEGTINFSATDTKIVNTTNMAHALWILNSGGAGSTINVDDLTRTTFLNNEGGAIYASVAAGTTTTINDTGAIFIN